MGCIFENTVMNEMPMKEVQLADGVVLVFILYSF